MTLIGIIGGAGVAATNKLQELIEIEYTKKGAYRDCQHPEMIIWQATKAPSRSMYLEGKGESYIDDYVDIANKLKNCGCNKICMCCNTAHYAIDEISKKAEIEFINLIEKVVYSVQKKNVKNVGLIASDGCLRGRVYEKYFEKILPNINIIYSDKNHQKLVTRGICNIKNVNRFNSLLSDERPKSLFNKVEHHLKANGAEIVIAGCTDIRVDYFKNNNYIDSLEVLKDSIIEEIESDNLQTLVAVERERGNSR